MQPKPWFVPEAIANSRALFWAGVPWRATAFGWVAPLWMFICGLGFGAMGAGLTGGPALDIRYGVLVPVGAVAHNLGHYVGGRLAGAPMRAVLVTSTLPYDLYDLPDIQPSRIHLARAFGGPTLSALIAIGALGAGAIFDSYLWRYFGLLNGMIAIAALAPVEGIDGSVVMREVRAAVQRRA